MIQVHPNIDGLICKMYSLPVTNKYERCSEMCRKDFLDAG